MTPSVIVRQIERGVKDFLLTTFPITSPFFRGVLENLLDAPGTLFRGPYLSIKLPFRPGRSDKAKFPQIQSANFEPFLHQEQSWERLGSLVGASTIVATGTGSGKTECFLYPILDHCWRNRGRKGVKAILIYPMNALATDQAQRLARMISGNPELHSYVSAGLYLGSDGEKTLSVMTADQLITDRATMRQSPPDILLTNYKMLDYLLLRPEDAKLWSNNEPETLRYLVVDELHTFDGAQGADLACLIRRLKERLKTPEKHLCCVGTSATLGDGGSADLRAFAQQLFAEPFDDESVIGEALLTPEEFFAGPARHFRTPSETDTQTMDPLLYESSDEYLAAQKKLWFEREPQELGQALKEHSYFHYLLGSLGGSAKAWDLLVGTGEGREFREQMLVSFLALLSSSRVQGRSKLEPLVQIRLQLWARELRRMVAAVDNPPRLAFADDLKAEELQQSLPVIHCRECGLTGWAGTAKDADTRILPDLPTFYNAFFSSSPNVRFLFPFAKSERDKQLEIPDYLCSACLDLQSMTDPGECTSCRASFDQLIPVWFPNTNKLTKMKSGAEKLRGQHNCPSCDGNNSLTIVGSRAASLTSVAISQLYASPFNEDKKLLAFSDSVQDASHRAGFFGARTYTFNLRGAIQKTVHASDGPLGFVNLADAFFAYWQERLPQDEFIATFLPPDMDWLDDYKALRAKGKLPANSDLPELVKRRLRWEIWSEYTFDCRIGRTLEKTGTSTLQVRREVWDEAVDRLHAELSEKIGSLRDVQRENVEQFAAGIVQNLKNRGGVWSAEIAGYVANLGEIWNLGKQRGKAVWRPNFSKWSRAPVFLTSRGGGDRFLSLVSPAGNPTMSWHQDWLTKSFRDVDEKVGKFAREIYETALPVLVQSGVLFEKQEKGALVWGLNPALFELTSEVKQFRCATCSFAVSVGAHDVDQFAGNRCMRYGCDGRFEQVDGVEDYYRRLYESGDVKRIFATEHTGLLSRKVREQVEEDFRENQHPGDPNLLSCTPTLEMGINIGDLSSLALCSVPPKATNYLQRVGRAGRTNGNSFILTLANARPHDLFFFFEPEEMIQGLVETPGCFLNASAVLERQFTAFVFDRWVESDAAEGALPSEMRPVLDAIEAGDKTKGFPANLLALFNANRTALEDDFLAMFGGEMEDYTRDRVRAFSRGTDLDVEGLERVLWKGLEELAVERKTFRTRVQLLTRKIREMKEHPAKSKSYEDELQELQREKGAVNALLTSMNKRKVLNFLTDEGLLPNYAFPEAGVVLRSIIYRRNEKAQDDEKKYKMESFEYERPAASAIVELAPANVFYAEGRRLEIDQINLQASKIEPWRFCSSCSYLEPESTVAARTSCPKCGGQLWSDEGQRRLMLKMRQVISTQSEQHSRSHDESDDREPQFYQKNMFVVKDDADITEAFFIDSEEVPFGFEFLRKVTLREVNFGEKGIGGAQFTIAGRTLADRPFEICGACGKVKKNGELKHAVYCRYHGKEEKEKVIEACFLYREFNSEAIRMLLPVAASFDLQRNIDSFVAALELGLRKKFRGNPGHLSTTVMEEPITGSGIRKQYLVLYDKVPGGTGYLKELMRDQSHLMEVFQLAYDALSKCRCQQDPVKDGCYRCLLAYHGRHDRENTSRQAAMSLLLRILENRQHIKRTKKLDSIKLNRLLESELEGLFIESLRRTGEGEASRRVTHHVVNGKQGFFLKILDGDHTFSYQIEPQVNLGPAEGVAVPCRADFVFYPERPAEGELPLVVFTDGYEYHADPHGNMRVAVDTAQRLALMRSGRYRVWSLTWDDVNERLGNRKAPAFKAETLKPGPKYEKLLEALDLVNTAPWKSLSGLSSFGALLFLLGGGRGLPWQVPAQAFAASLANKDAAEPTKLRIAERQQHADGSPLLVLEGSIESAQVQARDFTALRLQLEIVDDFAFRDLSAWKRAWREFLRLGNLLQFLDEFEFVTTAGLREHLYEAIVDVEIATAAHDAEERWEAELFAPELRGLCAQLVERGKARPEPGFELTDSDGEIIATAEAAWPALKRALLLPAELAGLEHFKKQGWDVQAVEATLETPNAFVESLPAA